MAGTLLLGSPPSLLSPPLFFLSQPSALCRTQCSGEHKNIEWESLFDIAIVGACKPAFLTDEYLSIFRVLPRGLLRNVEDKYALSPETFGTEGNVFQGGHWKDLHRILSIQSGDRILYVGDHMYSDILKSKRTLGWRTCLIIPELEGELLVSREEKDLYTEILKMRQLQYDLGEWPFHIWPLHTCSRPWSISLSHTLISVTF